VILAAARRLGKPLLPPKMCLLVEDMDVWLPWLSPCNSMSGSATPRIDPWSMRDFTLFDPSGVLWRIAQNTSR